MPIETNQGYFAWNGNASSGYAQLSSGNNISASPILVGVGQRIVVTAAFGYTTNALVYNVVLAMRNSNKFAAVAAGFAAPAQTGGSTQTQLASNYLKILSEAQNSDDNPGVLALSHTYAQSVGTAGDLIFAPGNLVGNLYLSVSVSGAVPVAAGDYVILAVDLY